MRPFVCSLLKCNSCNSESIPRITVDKIAKIKLPNYLPNVIQFKNEQLFLSELIEDTLKKGRDVIDINDSDLYLFIESNDPNSQEDFKIVELLYGIDVIDGKVECRECGITKNIQDGILIYE